MCVADAHDCGFFLVTDMTSMDLGLESKKCHPKLFCTTMVDSGRFKRCPQRHTSQARRCNSWGHGGHRNSFKRAVVFPQRYGMRLKDIQKSERVRVQ